MPLNMNTIGTGNGCGSGGNGIDGDALLISGTSLEKYHDRFPSYYISDYSNTIPNATIPSNQSISTSYQFQRMFVFKNKLYAVTCNWANTPSGNYVYTSNTKCTLNEVIIDYSVGASSISLTSIFDFYATNTKYTPHLERFIRMIPTRDYIYYLDTSDKSYIKDGVTKTCEGIDFCRFDGTSCEILYTMYVNNTYHPAYETRVITNTYCNSFCLLDHETPTFLIACDSSFYKITVDPFTCTKYTSPTRTYYDSNYQYLYYMSFTKYENGASDSSIFESFGIIQGKGYCSVNYRDPTTTSIVYVNRLYSFDFIDNDDNTFTLQNVTHACDLYGAAYANVVDIGMYTFQSSYYSAKTISAPMFFIKNYESGVAELKDYTDATSTSNKYGGSPLGNANLNFCVPDKLHGKIIYCAVTAGSSVTGTTIAYQDCNFTSIVDQSDNPYSIFTSYMRKGDVVYCSKNITYYKLDTSDTWIVCSNTSNKFVVPADGYYDVRSDYESPIWISQDKNGNITYLKFSQLSTTQIHGFFIAGMTVNETTITDSGEQDVTLLDFTETGLYVNMKGV